MSLLMKALEKAAKDREGTGAEPAPPEFAGNANSPGPVPGAKMAGNGLTLEPIAPPPGGAAPAASRQPSPRKPAGGAQGTRAATAAQPAQAAALMRAGQRKSGGGASYVREHPLMVFGTLAALFLSGYGGYVYLQITNPGMFTRQQPSLTQAPPSAAPVAPAPAATGNTPASGTEQPLIELSSLLPPLQPGAEKGKPTPPTPTAANAGTPSAAGATAPAPAPTAVAAAVAAAPAPAAAAAATAPPAPRDLIKVTIGGTTPAINPLLTEAYQALTAGNLESSQRLYNQLLRTEPNNIDALLALASIASQQSDTAQASKHYLRALELDPRHALAQAGLISMLGRADPLAAETRLKQLIARDPSAYLHFTLGNVYADQNRWPDAQQAYFQAYHLQPDNPDYAYNLAVGLEHVGQPKLALNYYRNAIQIANAKGRANFSIAAAQERISKLAKIVE